MQADLSLLWGNKHDILEPKLYKNMAACIHFLVKFLKKPNIFDWDCWEPRISAKRQQKDALVIYKRIRRLITSGA